MLVLAMEFSRSVYRAEDQRGSTQLTLGTARSNRFSDRSALRNQLSTSPRYERPAICIDDRHRIQRQEAMMPLPQNGTVRSVAPTEPTRDRKAIPPRRLGLPIAGEMQELRITSDRLGVPNLNDWEMTP
jgi:hypothetical protein